MRRQQLGLAPTNVNVNASSETLFILLLEDYLTCFLPIDPVLQVNHCLKLLFLHQLKVTFSENAIHFLDLQISKKIFQKNYPELEI